MDVNKKTIHLVLGVSSAGKSSFINSKISQGDWANVPVFMANEIGNTADENVLLNECVIHYNMLRPYENNITNTLLSDSIVEKIFSGSENIRAYLIVAPRQEIIKRCLLREEIEPLLRATPNIYSNMNIFEMLLQLDIANVYMNWVSFLEQKNIGFQIFNSHNNKFDEISLSTADAIIREKQDNKYTENEIGFLLEKYKFEYQRVELPFGKTTLGNDRSSILEYVGEDLSGKSVLDVGCAYGYFCFEAEKRKAKKVLGTELKRHRYLGANIIKEINGSEVDFLRQDIFEVPVTERFDVILLLNVLHHLKEPIKALRILSELCNEKLIIQFPTLADSKFRSTYSANKEEANVSAPLIGVSLLNREDQTFLFSHEAINRILLDHDKLFSKIEFYPSADSNERSIAVCYKN